MGGISCTLRRSPPAYPAPKTDGSFYVALEWLSKNDKGPSVGRDEDEPWSGQSYYWTSSDPSSAEQKSNVNYMIRVFVQ